MTHVTTTAATATIVPTFQSIVGGKPATCCDARTLHTYLGNARQFADWFKQRVEQYGFEAGRDFELVSQNCETKGRGGDRRSTDYHLSLNMAKELSMVENNEQGRAARRYFLECERRALEAAGQVVPASHTDTLIPSEAQTLRELVDRRCADVPEALQGKARAEIWSRVQHKFRVNKYSLLARTQLADAIAYIMGMDLRAIPPAQPQPARERINNGDLCALIRVVGMIGDHFHQHSAWTQGIWFYLRKLMGHPAPQPWYVDQLPELARHLTSAYADAIQVRALVLKIESEACKRIFRHGEASSAVLADLQRLCHAHTVHQSDQLQALPKWAQMDIQAITSRAHPRVWTHTEAAEQTNYFDKGVKA